MPHGFVDRIALRNYKSIAACDLKLGPLTFLVGPNGSGKSNFLDALRLVADGLNLPLDHAIRERGGIDDVRRRSTGHPHNVGIRLDLRVPPDGARAAFAFEIAARQHGAFDIKEERCWVKEGYYLVQHGDIVECSLPKPPRAAPDRLYLMNLSGVEEFRPLYDALTAMSFYNLNPEQIRDVQPPDPGRLLVRDGRNLASVLGRLQQESPGSVARIDEYLEHIVPDLKGVERAAIANKETLLFRQQVRGATHPWKFYANSMSDGTLRALGVLTALAQSTESAIPLPVVGIEEPEVALHPAAAGILFEALSEAAERIQVIVTSHSADLLDNKDVQQGQILAVLAESGVTKIGPLSEAGRDTLRSHLYTAGELLRMAQLEPDSASRDLEPEQLDLFAPLSP